MTGDPRPHLRALAEAAMPGAFISVPREWVLAVLDVPTVPPAESLGPAALTVPELAKRFRRHESTIRLWLEQDRFPGAYKLLGRDWRVPLSAVLAFEDAESKRKAPSKAAAKSVDLSAWRKVS